MRGGLKGVASFLGGPWGIAIGLATLTIGALSRAAEEGAATQAELENAVVNVADAAELLRTGDKGFWFSELDSVIDDVDEFRAALENMSNNNWFDDDEKSTALANSFKNISSALGPLVTSDLPAAQKAFKTLADRYELTGLEQAMMLEKMPEYRDALIQQATALGINLTGLSETERAYRLVELATGDTIPLIERFNGALEGDSVMGVVESTAAFGFAAAGVKDETDKAAQGAENAGDSIEGMGDQAESAEDRIARLSDIIRGFGNTQLDARAAARDLEQAFDDLSESIDENGTSLDVTTQAGRDNEDALDAIAKAARDNAAAIFENTGSQEQATAAMQLGREELIRQLEQFGITGLEAEQYADKLGMIPSNITTDAEFRKMAAEAAIEAWVAKWSGTRIYFDVVANTSPVAVPSGGRVAYYQGGMVTDGVQEFATGGFPSGVYDGVNGGIHKFAEREKGVKWEAYISGREADRDRNIGIAYESLRRMGVNGGGGSTTTVSAPITVQAVPGMSEEQVGLAAAEKLNYALRG